MLKVEAQEINEGKC